MFIIEATRRASRSAVLRIRDALIEYDSIVFKDVSVEAAPQNAFKVVWDKGTYVVAFNDPSVVEEEPEDFGRDCFD